MSKPVLTPDELQQKYPPPSVTAIIDALKAKQITVVAQKVWDQDGDYMSTCTFARDGKEASGCFHVGVDGNEAHSVEYFTFRGLNSSSKSEHFGATQNNSEYKLKCSRT